MSTRSVISWTSRTSSLLRGSRLALVLTPMLAAGLAGCQTSTPALIAPSRPASPVLALPSSAQIASAERAGLPATGVPGRRDHLLGGPPIDALGPSIARVDAWSDQRIVNGRVYGNLRWRTRSVEVRGR